MEAIINFWNYLKALLQVKIGFLSTAIDRRMTLRSVANIDESLFYPKDLKEDEQDNHSDVPKPGFYLSRVDAAVNGCLFKYDGFLDEDNEGPGFFL